MTLKFGGAPVLGLGHVTALDGGEHRSSVQAVSVQVMEPGSVAGNAIGIRVELPPATVNGAHPDGGQHAATKRVTMSACGASTVA